MLDSAGYHLKTEVPAYAADNDIKFYFTPTGASWPNRIECHLTALRKFAWSGACPATIGSGRARAHFRQCGPPRSSTDSVSDRGPSW